MAQPLSAPETALSAREILARLVAFPSVSRDSNLEIIGWIEAYLAQYGLTSRRVPSPDGQKANLYAVIGPEVAGGVALSGHTDVVPVDGQDWNTDPFILTEKDGRLYGRGAVDMKGFVALMLALVPQAVTAPLRRPLYLAFSYDEEIGCEGCVSMVEEMVARLPAPAATIVGEPSGMQVIDGHKGILAFEVTMRGHSVHSSLLHTGVSAVMEAARLIGWANQMNEENSQAEPGPLDVAFDPPWTTVHVGTIHGGTAINITAGECVFPLDFRIVPGDKVADWEARLFEEADRLRNRMQQVAPDANISLARTYLVPPLRPETDGTAERLAKRLTGRNDSSVVSYATEAGHFQRLGWSTIVCGPGDISRAHKADEYIELAELEQGGAFLSRVLATLCEEAAPI